MMEAADHSLIFVIAFFAFFLALKLWDLLAAKARLLDAQTELLRLQAEGMRRV